MNTPLNIAFCLTLVASTFATDGKFPLADSQEALANYAKRAGVEPKLTLDLEGGVKWEGVLIPAGTFVMGSPAGEARTEEESALEKQHMMTITRPLYLGKFELLQAQYAKVMGDKPKNQQGRRSAVA